MTVKFLESPSIHDYQFPRFHKFNELFKKKISRYVSVFFIAKLIHDFQKKKLSN